MNIFKSRARIVTVLGLLFLMSSGIAYADNGFSTRLFWGASFHDAIKSLQQFLTDENLFSGPVTGNYLGLTTQAVKDFQKREGITPTGYFGPVTMARANQIWGRRKNPPIPVPPTPTSTPPVIPPATTTPPIVPVPPVPTTTPPQTSGEIRLTAYLTGYTYWDNTPPGSADISNPIIHQKAGGTGTYADPVTIAVGHSIINGKDILDYPAGTRFYVPNLQKYFIVEDTCGDGNTPQNGPCHSLKTADQGAQTWLDMWLDGRNATKSAANSCAEALTGNFLVIQNPASTYAVVSGGVMSGSSCPTQHGNTVVLK